MPSNLEGTAYGLPFRSDGYWDYPPVTWRIDPAAAYPVAVSVVEYNDYLKGKITPLFRLGTYGVQGGTWRVPVYIGHEDGRDLCLLFVDATGGRNISSSMRVAEASKASCM